MRKADIVLGIAGSPRRGGNSEFLLDRAMAGAAMVGAATRKLVPNEMNFVPCQNCGYCDKMGICRFQDDMTLIYRNLEEATHIIVATPIYFTTVSAQLKAMIDRYQVHWARRFVLKQKLPPSEKRGLLLAVGGFKTERFLACTKMVVYTWMRTVGIKPMKTLFYPGVDEKGAAETHPTAGEECFEAGKALIAG